MAIISWGLLVVVVAGMAVAHPARATEADRKGQPESFGATLPVRLHIDPQANELTPEAVEGAWQAIDADGEVVAQQPLTVTLSDTAVAEPSGVDRPRCHQEGDSQGITRYPTVWAVNSDFEDYHLQYAFATYQLDNARIIDNNWQRHFMECAAGGGSTFNGSHQTSNGAGTTMEDPDTVIEDWNWGKEVKQGQITAHLPFLVPTGKGPVGIGSIEAPLGGEEWTGGQGPYSKDPVFNFLNDFASNLVHGFWTKRGALWTGATGDYRGNTHLNLWEYPMGDAVDSEERVTTIRGMAWIEYRCGEILDWTNQCTGLANPGPIPGLAEPSQPATSGWVYFNSDWLYDAESCYNKSTWNGRLPVGTPGIGGGYFHGNPPVPHYYGEPFCFIVVNPPDWILPTNNTGYTNDWKLVGAGSDEWPWPYLGPWKCWEGDVFIDRKDPGAAKVVYFLLDCEAPNALVSEHDLGSYETCLGAGVAYLVNEATNGGIGGERFAMAVNPMYLYDKL